MSRIKLRHGASVYCELVDLVDPWDTPELVFFHHGLGKHSGYWRGWMRALAGRYRLAAIDVLGNGRSSKPRGHAWSLESYADDVLDVLDAIGAERAHFVGEGMGGCVGLQLAARSPSRVQTLTLCATPFRPSEGRADLLRHGEEIARHGVKDFVDGSLADRMDWSLLPSTAFDWFRGERLAVSPRIMSEQMTAQARVDVEWTLPLITAPTLLIVPGASPSNANTQMREMARSIATTRVIDFPTERQWVTFARAAECAQAFLDFVHDAGS